MALMEEVLRTHHHVMRSLLDKHGGYESATEGDSFILAFHSVDDAVSYAVDAQHALLSAEWPRQLLDSFPLAAPCHVVPTYVHPVMPGFCDHLASRKPSKGLSFKDCRVLMAWVGSLLHIHVASTLARYQVIT
jgi:hypothetical protein